MSTTNKAEFSISYDGPALENHTMDVQTLGPALLAFGNLCSDAHRVIYGEGKAEINVFVKSTSPGSFDINFELVQKIIETGNDILDFFSNEDLPTTSKILALLGFCGVTVGLLQYLQWKAGREVETKEETEDEHGNKAHKVTVQGDNNTTIIISDEVYNLSRDAGVRMNQYKVLSPLAIEGVDGFKVRQGSDETKSVSKREVIEGYYDVPLKEVGAAENITEPQMIKAWLNLRAPVFAENNKWHFTYGALRLTASILDANFLDNVFVKGKRFGVGDMFFVDLRITQVQLVDGKIRNNYEIVNVIEIKEGPEQLDFLK